ncbi:serine acetyltransferase [Marivirga arenosa]|uniref:Serine acetyltransferase n=1 Tax=Marivirga arenosa TaxID=3059076 RepID=A0AA49JHZ5_9BACT|nr:serine acetyltransferase [Marivirga sp. ABR2-2]WKK84212.1 serine acetyltransferase [Marivirga sp. ABR2-2]
MNSLEMDRLRYGSNSFREFIRRPGYRFCHYFRWSKKFGLAHPLGFISRLLLKSSKVKYGFQIPHFCEIGGGLFLGHFGNIVINQHVKIGINCNLAQGVTIGYVSRGKIKGCPTIGDNVWIGANAVVVGNIKIGNNVLIAPLSFVNFDVPDNAVVSGNPAKIINYKGSVGYVNNTLN